jgi:pantoate--beta-alanine ligase
LRRHLDQGFLASMGSSGDFPSIPSIFQVNFHRVCDQYWLGVAVLLLETILEISELRSIVARWKADGQVVAFVPTMGALHEGHLSLVRQAKSENARVVVSVFVNPLQFGPSEDFARYPRTLKEDIEKLKTVEADVVFAPSAAEMYPTGFQTTIHNKGMATVLCGNVRPTHFDGMLTVVAKLLNIVSPNFSLFGKKDYQQWRLVERMVLDLGMPFEIRGCDTVREVDGLAMSSRNRYLAAEERAQASLIYQGLSATRTAWENGERSYESLSAKFSEYIARCPKMTIQYAEIVDRHTLLPSAVRVGEQGLVMIVAVLFGDVRLIDNLEF